MALGQSCCEAPLFAKFIDRRYSKPDARDRKDNSDDLKDDIHGELTVYQR